MSFEHSLTYFIRFLLLFPSGERHCMANTHEAVLFLASKEFNERVHTEDIHKQQHAREKEQRGRYPLYPDKVGFRKFDDFFA